MKTNGNHSVIRLTKREKMALEILCAITSREHFSLQTNKIANYPKVAVDLADTLINELNNESSFETDENERST